MLNKAPKGWLRITTTLAAGLATALLLAGCSGTPGNGQSSANDGKLQILALIYPLGYAAQQVAGDHADVTVLTPPGSEPHDYELTPKQIASLSKADLIVYQEGIMSATDEAIAQSGNKHVVETGSLVQLRTAAEDDVVDESDSSDTTNSHENSDYLYDPHTWQDPTNMAKFGDAIAQQLAEIDPGHKADYQQNAASFDAAMNSLDQDYSNGLKTCQRTEFMTTHAAFGYLAARYHLTQLAIAGISPEDEPSPARMADLQKEAKAHGITTIFYETLVSPAYAQTMANDLGLKTDVLDPLEGITSQSRGTDYPSVMRSNLSALETANGCSA